MLENALNQVFHSGMIQQFDVDQYVTQEKDHGRLETRLSLVEHDMSLLGDIALEWAGLKTVGVVVSIRQEGSRPAETMQIKIYISSAELSAKNFLQSTRANWSIENQMHWLLDAGFNEGSCRIHREQAGENFAVVRHISLNLLTAETSFKGGIQHKRVKCAMDVNYLSKVLRALE